MQYGETPFLTTAVMGHVEVAGFLLDNGSSILELAAVSDHQLFGTFYKYTSIDARLWRASLLWRVVDGVSAKVL